LIQMGGDVSQRLLVAQCRFASAPHLANLRALLSHNGCVGHVPNLFCKDEAMRSILLSIVVLGGACLMVSNGAQPLELRGQEKPPAYGSGLPTAEQIDQSLIDTRPVKPLTTEPTLGDSRSSFRQGYGGIPDGESNNEIHALRQQFMSLTNERVERMDGAELKKAIAEMRIEQMAVSLMKLAEEPADDPFAASKAKLAAKILGAKNQEEVEEIIRTRMHEIARAKEIDRSGFKPRDE
jgi:hypothetical protein